MIDYKSITNAINSGRYYDNTDCFEWFINIRLASLSGCKQTGSSLFLKSFACFLDESINTQAVFEHLKVGSSNLFHDGINKYRVLYLDFSDFNAENYESALAYIADKMSNTYKYFHDLFNPENDKYFYVSKFEKVIDIIEKKSTDKVLQNSLQDLVVQLRGHESHYSKQKLAILIDNMVELERVAERYGYTSEMNSFLEGFIVKDVYKFCDLFIHIIDCETDHEDSFFSSRYKSDAYFCVSTFDLKNRIPQLIVPSSHKEHFEISAYQSPKTDWTDYISRSREKIEQIKFEEKQEHLRFIESEKARYKTELHHRFPLISENLGIRKKEFDKRNTKYIALNSLLQEIYRNCSGRTNTESIYSLLQKINREGIIIKNTGKYTERIEQLIASYPKWDDVMVSDSGSWIQSICSNADKHTGFNPNSPASIKVYVCFDNTEIGDIYIDSLSYLLGECSDSFATKIATYNRADQMCYWISPKDLKVLEDFYKPYEDNIVMSLPFLAYKQKLGISKEFFGTDVSHNHTQAQIIADYFKTTHDINNIDLGDMYNNYIAKWNADIYEEYPNDYFKQSSALSFVIILDTLDCILKEKDIEKSILLSGDKDFLYALSNCKCWADLNSKYPAI